jgi:hypothetical protein
VNDVAVEVLDLSLESPTNVGVTAFQLRKLPLERARFEAFVQIHAASPAPVEARPPRRARLEIRLGRTLVAVRDLMIEPGGRERLLIPVAGEAGGTLSLRVGAEGDVLPTDDELHARIPETRPTRVLWIAPEPDPFTQLALASLGDESDIEVLHGGPDSWPPESPDGERPPPRTSPCLPRLPSRRRQASSVEPRAGFDVAIFERWAPPEWPKGISVIVIDPPGPAGPVRAARLKGDGLPVTALRPADERHPVLYGVATPRVEVTQTAVLESEGPLAPLWVGPSGPVLAAGDVRGQRVVVMAFAPGRSERLPLMASFPLLMGNAIYWSAAGAGRAAGPVEANGTRPDRRTGELVPCPGGEITWSVPTPTGTSEEAVPVRGRFALLDRVGLWRAGDAEGSAALLSPRETLVSAKAGPTGDGEAGGASLAARGRPHASGGEASGFLRGDLTPLLMWAILVVLAVESYLFHRRAVY